MAVSLQNRVVALLDKNILTDVTFIVQGQEVKGHKVLIASYPGVLRDHVMTDAKRIDLGETTSPGTFKDILRYMYTDQVNITNSNVFELLHAATSFSLGHLEQLCSNYILECMSPANMGEFTKQALHFNSKALQGICIDYFGANTERILDSEEFVEFSEDVLNILYGSDNIDCQEILLFSSCVKWAENKCRLKNLRSTPKKLRATLGSILDKIRFVSMDMTEFLRSVVETMVLSNAQVGQIILDIQMNKDLPHPTYRTVLKEENVLDEKDVPGTRPYHFSQCSSCTLDLQYGLMSYTSEKDSLEEALLSTQRYISPGMNNFIEIEICEGGSECAISVGIVPSESCVDFYFGMRPGWVTNSIGYHAEDGGIHLESTSPSKRHMTGKRCNVGDRMGVGVIFTPGECPDFPPIIYFTKNSSTIFRKEWAALNDGRHHLAIGMKSEGEKAYLIDSDMWLLDYDEG